ncbi:MAG: aldo/keto reductase [Alphaproteobacteria bacterium]|nr:aldo/keto reductase [Alphaproteobacteria bacterium]
MEYRPLGRTGVQVSQFCLGTMMFGGKADEAESLRIVDHALDRGVNFIDTANVYAGNESERIVGKALARDGRRDKVVLATKAFMPQGDGINDRGPSRRHIVTACEDSLQRLQTDHIDLYQMHRSSADVPVDETLRALDDLIRAGKVRYIGSSMFPGWQIVEALWVSRELGLNRFVCEQSAYHMLDRTAEREVIPAARSFGLAVIPWGPLCGGLLSGKYHRDGGPSGARWQDGRDNFGRSATPLAWDVIDLVRELAAGKGCTPSQLALAWCAGQPGVTAPIVGPRTLEQITDNLGAVDVTLTADDLARIDALNPPCGVAVRYYDAANRLDLRPHLHRSLV